MAYIIGIIGLALDILGVWIIFLNALKYRTYAGIAGADIANIIESVELETRNEKKWKYSKFGMVVLTLGFILQAVSMWMQYPK
ncbi:MAG: hypothetical protein HN728_04395 [Flavobacteriales bacterium]|jgi:hypothetical protein|nr:hypothetical protein [Flavobacteriales bacterium]MBT7749059.1 hypothetical protein [Flavobacteriales bacterium]